MKIEIEFELSENELAYFEDNDKKRLTRLVTQSLRHWRRRWPEGRT